MTQALVIYASTHGHTARIAARIARTLEQSGAVVDLRRADPKLDLAPSDYDAVVVGASIHAGRHQGEIAEWVGHHAATLSTMPSAFFSVSMSAADEDEEGQVMARRYVDELVEQTGWTPRRTRCFAGALQYREYDFFTRLLVKLMSRRGHNPTDTSRDYDFTDWDAVERFGRECAELLPAPAVS
jgi:menaquinone-dependent protoporphyrinogen oxidase